MNGRRFYDLDGIESGVRETVKDWPHPATFTRTPERLTVIQPGLFPGVDPDGYLDVTAAGFCEIHWSIPRGLVIQGIVEDHALAPEDATDG